MTEIFVMRDRINRFVKEYETWFLIIAKFIGMMFVFSCVNSQLGYFEVLNNPMVNILLALICSIIPGSFSVFIVAAVIAAHMVKLSVLLAVLTVVIMLIVYLMFLKFAPGQSVVLLAVPVLMQYNLHYMIPILAGMYFSPYAVVPAVIGLFMVKFLGYACAAVSMTGTGMSINLEGATEAISTIFGQLADDKSIWSYAIAAAVTMTVVYLISDCGRCSSRDHCYVFLCSGIWNRAEYNHDERGYHHWYFTGSIFAVYEMCCRLFQKRIYTI